MKIITPNKYYSKSKLKKFLHQFGKSQSETRIRFLFNLPMFGNIAEIGVADGNFSECILKINKPKNLHLIDCWEKQTSDYKDINNLSNSLQNNRYQSVINRFSRFIQVKIHRGYSLQIVKLFPVHYFDWIYLDANHVYKQVKSDLESWYQKVKPNGIIAGNDYTSKSGIGVIKGVDEFIRRNNFEMFLFDDDPWHSYALRKKRRYNINSFMEKINIYKIKWKRWLFHNRKFDYLYTMIVLYLRRNFSFTKC